MHSRFWYLSVSIFSVDVHRIRSVLNQFEHHLKFFSLCRTDCSAQVMDISLCVKRPSWLVDRKRMRMASNSQWLLLTAVLLYLTNQVNSQKKSKCIRVREDELIAVLLLFGLGSDLESILNPSGCG